MSTDQHPGKGPHDMGGDDAGPIDTTDHGMRFWEKQANGLRTEVVRTKLIKLDELRRAAEDLGDDYYNLSYFERTTTALRNTLIEHELITDEELTQKMTEIRARFDVPDEMLSDIKKGKAQ